MVKRATEFLLRLRGKRWPYVIVTCMTLVASCCTLLYEKKVTGEGENQVTQTSIQVDWKEVLRELDLCDECLARGDQEAAGSRLARLVKLLRGLTGSTE